MLDQREPQQGQPGDEHGRADRRELVTRPRPIEPARFVRCVIAVTTPSRGVAKAVLTAVDPKHGSEVLPDHTQQIGVPVVVVREYRPAQSQRGPRRVMPRTLDCVRVYQEQIPGSASTRSFGVPFRNFSKRG
jgi:hypothetical protein